MSENCGTVKAPKVPSPQENKFHNLISKLINCIPISKTCSAMGNYYQVFLINRKHLCNYRPTVTKQKSKLPEVNNCGLIFLHPSGHPEGFSQYSIKDCRPGNRNKVPSELVFVLWN
jgi:hypothetical protein